MGGVVMSNVPKLRFKEFSEEWEEKLYGDIYTFYSTNSLSRDKLNYENGKVYNIHYGDIHTKFSTIFKLENEHVPYINNDVDLSKIKDENYCKIADLVIADASEDYADIGKTIEIISLNNKKTLAGLHTFLARPNRDIVSLGYMAYMLQSWKVRWQVMRIAQGTKVLGLATSRLSKITLEIPSKKEQKKIATFLTSVDKKIDQLNQKVNLLQAYKKGVMQKIFSQEIRFKADDGSEFPEWKNTKLEKIFVERKEFSQKNNNLEHISLTKAGVVPKSERYERDFLVGNDVTKKYKVTRLNDICYNPANLKFGVICRNTYGDGIFSPIYVTFMVVNAEVKFIEYLVTRKDFINKVRKYEEGTVYERQAVKPLDFVKFSIPIPIIDEQTKIANFLSSIDTKIEQTQEQLKATKAFKKSLLQKMFI